MHKSMNSFIWNVKEFGLKIALDGLLIDFVKWFTGAVRVRLSYPEREISDTYIWDYLVKTTGNTRKARKIWDYLVRKKVL